MPRYTCSRCGIPFPSRQALGGHRNGVLTCTPAAAAAADAPAPAVDVPPAAAAAGTLDAGTLDAAGTLDVGANAVVAARIGAAAEAAAATAQFGIAQLLQRPTRNQAHKHIVVPLRVRPATRYTCNTANTYRLYETQLAYEEYCDIIRQQYSDEFWRVFATVYKERQVIVDRVLKTCKDVFVTPPLVKRFFAVRAHI